MWFDIGETLDRANELPPEPPKPRQRSGWEATVDTVKAGARGVGGAVLQGAASTLDMMKASGNAQVVAAGADAFATDPTRRAAAAARRTLESEEGFTSRRGTDLRRVEEQMRPDPATATTAEEIAYSAVRSITKFGAGAVVAGVPGMLVSGAEEGISAADDLRRKGVDQGTRTKVGAVTGAVGALGAVLPMTGPTIKATAGLWAVGGPGAFMGQQFVTREILKHANYEELARQYDPLDETGLWVSSIFPGVFAAGGVARLLKARQTPTARAASVPDSTPQPGTAADVLPAGGRGPNVVGQPEADAGVPGARGAEAAPARPAGGGEPAVTPARAAGLAEEAPAVRVDEAEPGAAPRGEADLPPPRTVTPEQVDAAMVANLSRHADLVEGGLRVGPQIELPLGDAAPGRGASRAAATTPTEPISAIKLVREDRSTGWVEYAIQDETGRRIGSIDGERLSDGSIKIHNAGIDDPAATGKGYGVRAYEALAQEAASKGGRLISDPEVSAAAVRVYESLERRGYTVTRRPEAVLDADGRWSMPDDRGVYEVRAPERAGMADLLTRAVGLPPERVSTRTAATEAGMPARPGQPADPDAVAAATQASARTVQADARAASVSARVAEIEAKLPDAVMRVTDKADGQPARAFTIADELEAARREATEGTDTELGTADRDLLRVAANCAIVNGAF